ncbi:MAG TPA: hypothetical protein VFW75_13660 [Acetobacteraceae bacterium]|nr:hypothetical protein [Acetobacteraceae bacterium]
MDGRVAHRRAAAVLAATINPATDLKPSRPHTGAAPAGNKAAATQPTLPPGATVAPSAWFDETCLRIKRKEVLDVRIGM